MPSRSPRASLEDIRDNIELAREFLSGFSYEDFRADRRTFYAVTRCLEIISEAPRRLPAELKSRHVAIAWSDVAGAGNIYRHGYEMVSDEIVWLTAHALEPLRQVALEELRGLENR